MANISAADVKRLREATGAGMMDSKKALEEAGGDFDQAVELLRIKGAKSLGKRGVLYAAGEFRKGDIVGSGLGTLSNLAIAPDACSSECTCTIRGSK